MRPFRLYRLVVAAMLLALLAVPAGAARGAAQSKPVHITFWNYWDGQNGDEMTALVKRFNQEHPDIQVDNVFLGFNDLLPKLQAAVTGGDAPDIAAGDLIWMPGLARSRAIIPVDSYAAQAGIDLNDFYPAQLEASRYNGQTYGLPVSTNNLQLFYNKDLFRQAGLDPDKPPTTWDELRQMAKQCTNADQGISGMELYTEPGEGLTWQFQVYLWESGGSFLTDDMSHAAFNTDAGRQSLQFWVDLLKTDKSAPLSSWGAFGQGQACMAMDGSWMVSSYTATDAPFEVGTASFPVPTGGAPATNMGGEQMVIFKSDDAHQQAAATFGAWLSSPDVQREWDQQTGFMPVRQSVANDPAYVSWVMQNQPALLPFVQGQATAHSRPAVPNYPQVSDAFSRAMEQALVGDKSVNDTLTAAGQAVDGVLSGT